MVLFFIMISSGYLLYLYRYSLLSTFLTHYVSFTGNIHEDENRTENYILKTLYVTDIDNNKEYLDINDIDLKTTKIHYDNYDKSFMINEKKYNININPILFHLNYEYNNKIYSAIISNSRNKWTFPTKEYEYNNLVFTCPIDYLDIPNEAVRYAGPKGNFYSDTEDNLHLSPSRLSLNKLSLTNFYGKEYNFNDEEKIVLSE